jgi:hypothetical protein
MARQPHCQGLESASDQYSQLGSTYLRERLSEPPSPIYFYINIQIYKNIYIDNEL